MEDLGDVAMKDRSHIEGCSSKINGQVGPNLVLEVENQRVNLMNIEEMAQLAIDNENIVSENQSHDGCLTKLIKQILDGYQICYDTML
jgi:hypothetical protein